jgi:hypothetical protein
MWLRCIKVWVTNGVWCWYVLNDAYWRGWTSSKRRRLFTGPHSIIYETTRLIFNTAVILSSTALALSCNKLEKNGFRDFKRSLWRKCIWTFWIMATCGLVGSQQRFRETSSLSFLQSEVSIRTKQVVSKRWWLHTKQYGVTTRKAGLHILIGVETSNPTYSLFWW